MTMNKHRVGLVSLGCAKNLVDSETMLGLLEQAGYSLTTQLEQAEVVVINTCAFIRPARQESLEKIRQLAGLKTRGNCQLLVVAGCLSQQQAGKLALLFPEVDVFVGTGDVDDIVKAVEKKRSSIAGTGNYSGRSELSRRVSTFPWAYLKITEGCSNRCSYCLIPRLRGPLRSKPQDLVIEEAQSLVNQGFAEIVLVGQDTTQYGRDFAGRSQLAGLMEKLSTQTGSTRLRLLYCHPDHIDDQLLAVIAGHENICNYLDIPLQHSHGDILNAMGRNGANDPEKLVARIRARVPDISLRSSFITGFPGETDSHFQHLLEFIRRVRLDHVGVFQYSRERGTKAARLPGQVSAARTAFRHKQLMLAQRSVVKKHNVSMIGRVFDVIIDQADRETGLCQGRSCREAPETDSVIIFDGCCEPGQRVKIRCTGYSGYDLQGVIDNDA